MSDFLLARPADAGGLFLHSAKLPDKAVKDFDILVALAVHNSPFSDLDVVDQFLHRLTVQLLQMEVAPDGPGPLMDICNILFGLLLAGQQLIQAL